MIFLKILKLNKEARLPCKQHESDAAFDLYACVGEEEIIIPPGEVVAIPTGLAFDFIEGYEVEIHSRSGLASTGIFVANGPATIDSGYTGEVKILLYNSTTSAYNIADGRRVAQLKVRKVLDTKIIEVGSIKDKDRGNNGFGSTGK